MAAADSFARLMGQLSQGDQDAAAVVFHRFRARLIALARSRLSARIQRREDPEDVVQSAYRSFFRRHAAGDFDIAGWNELWSLLTIITVKKSINRVAHHLARRRSVAGEVGSGPQDAMPDLIDVVVDRQPTPEEAVILGDTVESLLRDLGPRYHPVVELCLQGYTSEEIARRTGRGETTVRRQKRWIKERLLRMHEDTGRP
jgi:RNA polymerase sigma-70 factor (ECF subfamily)